MATKLFKRTNAKYVFDRLAKLDDPVESGRHRDLGIPIRQQNSTATTVRIESDESRTMPTKPKPTSRLRYPLVAGAGFAASVPPRRPWCSSPPWGCRVFWAGDSSSDTTPPRPAGRPWHGAKLRHHLDHSRHQQHRQEFHPGSRRRHRGIQRHVQPVGRQLRQVLIDNKAMGKGIVIDSAIKSATKTKFEVLLFIDQSITNAVNPYRASTATECR